MGLYINLICNW